MKSDIIKECPRCDKHPESVDGVVPLMERKNDGGSCSIHFPSSSSQQSTVVTISENSTPTFVYQRRKKQKGFASVFPAQASTNANPSDNYPRTGEEFGSMEDMDKIIGICFVNDSCSSSKSNADICEATLKTEVDDTGEYLSSDAIDDISEKDACVYVPQGLEPTKTHASPQGLGVNSDCSYLQLCKVCEKSEITLKMLICDQCEEAFHVSCCKPRVKMIPRQEWFCHSCLKKKSKIMTESTTRESLEGSRKDVLGPIAVMLEEGTEWYATKVRIGPEFQAEVLDCTGPDANEIDYFDDPPEMNPSEGVSFQEGISRKPSRLTSISNWMQCRQVIDGVGEGADGTVCGKWRRAPLFEVQTGNWECFCSVLWDPTHADCAVPQEVDTDQVLKDLKYMELLRPRLAVKKRKLGPTKSVDSKGPVAKVRNTET